MTTNIRVKVILYMHIEVQLGLYIHRDYVGNTPVGEVMN